MAAFTQGSSRVMLAMVMALMVSAPARASTVPQERAGATVVYPDTTAVVAPGGRAWVSGADAMRIECVGRQRM